jgi:predicted  nucleic acid-binding Zn-ribbon protein
MTTRDAYIEKIKARIDAWNADIDKMQAKAKEAGAEARIRHEENIEEMKKQRAEAEQKLQEARNASEDAWKDMQGGFEKAWSSISDAFADAAKRFN